MNIFILFLMVFLSIVDDYYLQGILAKLKQKKWWKENAPDEKYRNDYIIALLQHSFSWAFMMMLPIIWINGFVVTLPIGLCLMANVMIHAVVDHWKANLLQINLIQDQLLHLSQIWITWLLLLV